jgi:hypothetical protein
MNGLLIVLCMFGWALYVVHTNSSGGTVAQNAFAASSPAAQAAAPSIKLQPVASAAMQSPHAITPDETPRPAPASSSVPPPQIQTTENIKPPSEAEQDLVPASGQDAGEQLSVTRETSIRSGPSASAQLIGRAHAGATLRVKSREAGWVQFVDPVANETGWISMAYLGPADTVGNTPFVSPTPSKHQPKKTARAKPSKPVTAMRNTSPHYAALQEDREFEPPRRGRLFGLFWRR